MATNQSNLTTTTKTTTTAKALLTDNEIYDLMSVVNDKLSFEEIEQLQHNPYDVFNINKS